MNGAITDATVKHYFYATHDQLRTQLQNFVDADNFARRLKTLRGLTPYELIPKAWTSHPSRVKISPPPANAGTEQLILRNYSRPCSDDCVWRPHPNRGPGASGGREAASDDCHSPLFALYP